MSKLKFMFSIGYEGMTIENYISILKYLNISMLIDVRHNNFSFKKEFSRNIFKENLKKHNIEYKHFSNLGIQKRDRLNIHTEKNYKKVFDIYKIYLTNNHQTLYNLKKVFDNHDIIGITCFENEHTCCHRSVLIDYFNKNICKINSYIVT